MAHGVHVLSHTPIFKWLKIKNVLNISFSLLHKILTTAHCTTCISLWLDQPSGRTRSSSLVTTVRRPSSYCFKITHPSFRCASSSLWNKIPASFRKPRSSSVTIITPSITLCLWSIPDSRHTYPTIDPPTYRTVHWTPVGLPPRIPYCWTGFDLVSPLPLPAFSSRVCKKRLNWLSVSIWRFGHTKIKTF